MSWAIGPLIYSNLWVSLCAGALAYSFGGTPAYFTFIFCGTFCAYGLNMLSGLSALRQSDTQSIRHLWWLRNWRIMQAMCGLAAFTAIILLPWLGLSAILLLSVPAFVTLLYVLPIFYWDSKWVKLREVGLGKAFLIAGVWALLCSFIPLLMRHEPLQNTIISTLSLGFFILSITIPFDVRDMRSDELQRINTLPLLIGWRNALHASLIILLISFFLRIINIYTDIITIAKIAVVYTITAILIHRTHSARSETWFGFFLDGTIMAFALLSGSVHR